MSDLTEARFLNEVSTHEMKVIQDDGVYRHISFRKPDSGDMAFQIITWPWHLCYSGDMGTYVFCRLEDMFEFFRTRNPRNEGHLYINEGYWAEKIVAQDKCDGITRYSPDMFRSSIQEWMDDNDASKELREEIKEEVLYYADDGEFRARQAVEDFSCDGWISDFWEASLQDYTLRFTWCCYAISWGIEQYDRAAIAKATGETK